MVEHYYKYRSLKNFARFVDIVMNKRLYGCTYNELDDAMEGRYLHPIGIEKDILTKIHDEKSHYYICSLATSPSSSPMWALYADESKGCCIELEVTSPNWDPYQVHYVKDMPTVDNSPIEIITTKHEDWRHQHEVRFLKSYTGEPDNRSRFMSIKIHSIIFGLRVKDEDYRLYKKLINALDKDIKVDKLSWRNTQLSY